CGRRSLGLLFCNRNGRAYTSQKVVEYQLWPLLDALKIKRARFHAFQHAHTLVAPRRCRFTKSGPNEEAASLRIQEVGGEGRWVRFLSTAPEILMTQLTLRG